MGPVRRTGDPAPREGIKRNPWGSALFALDTELDLKETALGYRLGVSLKLRNLKGSCASQACKSRRIECYFWREKGKLELAGGTEIGLLFLAQHRFFQRAIFPRSPITTKQRLAGGPVHAHRLTKERRKSQNLPSRGGPSLGGQAQMARTLKNHKDAAHKIVHFGNYLTAAPTIGSHGL